VLIADGRTMTPRIMLLSVMILRITTLREQWCLILSLSI